MGRIKALHPAWIAGIIAITVLLWLASGIGKDDSKAEQGAQTSGEASQAEDKIVKVEITNSQAEIVTREAITSARTAAVRSVRIRAQTSGRVKEITAKRGSLLEKNAVIARLALDERSAQLRQAKAVLKQRELQYEAAKKLRQNDYMTEVELAQSKANLEIARAEVERIQKDVEHTVIRAPFAGLLNRRPIEVGDYVQVGDEVGYIIEQDPYIVKGAVSEDEVSYLRVGQPGRAILADGTEKEGILRYVAGEADEQTRTYQVELEVPNPNDRLIAGTSAKLHLPLEKIPAHKLEPATLSLNKDGDFGIKSVDSNQRVVFHKADIVRNEDGMVWLGGLPENLRVITVGQGFVSAGDKVEVVEDARAALKAAKPSTATEAKP